MKKRLSLDWSAVRPIGGGDEYSAVLLRRELTVQLHVLRESGGEHEAGCYERDDLFDVSSCLAFLPGCLEDWQNQEEDFKPAGCKNEKKK